MTRPLTTRDARRAYLDATRVPRVSKAEERRREREELERIREEDRQGRERARARAARERKRAREEEERAEKKRRGEPVVRVTASQGMISAFFGRGRERKGRGGERDAGAGGKVGCVDERSATEEREGVDSKDENQRNAQCGEAQACTEPDGQELDDLFLSASQLDREVGGTSQTPRKRSRDEAFRRPDPPPPKPPDRAGPRPPAGPGPEESYDLGVSSQELLQLEARETGRASALGEGRVESRGSPRRSSKGIPAGPVVPAEQADPDVSFAESFDLSSQDLRELDALGPLPSGHPTSDSPRNLEPDKSLETSRVESDMRGPETGKKALGGEESRPSPTSGKRPVPCTGTRSCTMPKEGLHRGMDICPSQGKPRGAGAKGEACGDGHGKATAARKQVATKGGPCLEGGDGGAVPEQVRTDTPRHPKDGGVKARAAMPGPASPDLDDDAWWEDLDNTDLAALLECPA